MRQPRPKRCKDGKSAAVQVGFRVSAADHKLVKRLGRGSITTGFEFLINYFRERDTNGSSNQGKKPS
jgi:hypothetical protein